MADSFTKYNALWPAGVDALQIEQACIKKGGKWINKAGVECGLGLFHHYKNAQLLMWPEDDHHRWSDLILSEILNNKHTAIIGPKDAGKTFTMARYGLTDYFMFPEETLILMSSTDVRGLELRVWGAVKDLWRRAKERYDWLAGSPIDSKHAICTDSLAEDMDVVRDMRKGIICIPCRSTSGAWLGINSYVGLKQKRRRLLSDEVQFMAAPFLEAPASLDGADFKAVYVGHPLGQGDPLDKLAEPKNGWGTEGEITKTTVWESKFVGGRTINLVGTDSPNFDQTQIPKSKFSYLVDQKMIDGVVSFYTKDSSQYWSKCAGIRRTGLFAHRVITIKLCEQSRAFEQVIWKGTPTTKVYSFDPAFGGIGGDRCVGGALEFGLDMEDRMVLVIHPHTIIPVSVRYDESPEDQIAKWVMNECVRLNIPPENVFFDSTSRGGGIIASFARIWSGAVNPVEFGGKATNRPVTLDHYITDPVTKQRRLKLCYEEYSKFVTELWFTVRYAIESNQIRELAREVAEEGAQREWIEVSGGRTELETKADMKERTGRSPDLFDQLCVGVEGARRKGFNISKLANQESEAANNQWLDDLAKKQAERRAARQLDYAA
jgi:hypothetical protein